jgi:hypothetical protein
LQNFVCVLENYSLDVHLNYGLFHFQIKETLDTASCITVLRRTAKVYINTRRFTRAEALIRHAVELAGSLYGRRHPLYADTLQDYGFCLLHLDLVSECVEVGNE